MVLWTIKDKQIYIKQSPHFPIRKNNYDKLVIEYSYLDLMQETYNMIKSAMKHPKFTSKNLQFWTFLNEDRWMQEKAYPGIRLDLKHPLIDGDSHKN